MRKIYGTFEISVGQILVKAKDGQSGREGQREKSRRGGSRAASSPTAVGEGWGVGGDSTLV